MAAVSGAGEASGSVRVDSLAFRRVMGLVPTGVAVLTAQANGEPHGMTINSFTAVSLSPLMILVCVKRSSRTAAAIRQSGQFAVNVLDEAQERVSRRFSGHDQLRFSPGPVALSRDGTPKLEGVLAFLDCAVSAVHEMGDHFVFYGAVKDLEASVSKPLVYWQGAYTSLI